MATIAIKATEAYPFPPEISDSPTHMSDGTEGGDKDFVTEVISGESICFKISSDDDCVITNITAISHNSTIFMQAPTKNNDGTWQATAANHPNTEGSYSISYEVALAGVKLEYRQDPKIKIK